VTSKPTVCVVGGGAIGLSSSVYLARSGCSVVLLEQDQLTSGSSSLSVGVYTRQYTDPFEIRMRMYSFDALERLERDTGLHLRRIGYLRLARDVETMQTFADGLDVQRSVGMEDGVLLTRADLSELLPSMRVDDLAGGLFGRSDGYLDGHQLCMTYAEMAQDLGVDIRTRTALLGREPGVRASHRLITTSGELDADVVVNAAGAWAQRVGEILGAPIEIIPQRHQACVISLESPVPYVVPEVMDYVPGSGEEGLYFRQERDDALIAGLHTNDVLPGQEEDPDTYFRGVESDYVEMLAARLLDRLPGLKMGVHSGWAGLYPMSRDSQIVVGPPADDPTIISACALGGLGIHLAPPVGRMVAEYATLGSVEFLEGAERLSPERFNVASR
jgi:sarcosine oxidase subunit beta